MTRLPLPSAAAALLVVLAAVPAQAAGRAFSGPARGTAPRLAATAPPPGFRPARVLPGLAAPDPVGELLADAKRSPESASRATSTAPPPPVAVPPPALTLSVRGIAQGETEGWRPPDPSLGVGPGNAVAVVNQSIAVFDKDGNRSGLRTLQSFFGYPDALAGGPSIFDPKVAYDPAAGRFLVLALTGNFTDASFYLLAASKGPAPGTARADWHFYALDATRNGGAPSGTWADYPGLGFDGSPTGMILVTSNQYAFSGASFAFARLRVLRKRQVYRGDDSLKWKDFWGLRNRSGRSSFTVQPAQALSPSSRSFLLNTAPGGAARATLWKVRGTPVDPVLRRRATVPLGRYRLPADALQPGGGPPIDTGDCRVTSAVFRAGRIHAAFAHAVDADGDGSALDESAIRLLSVNPRAKTAAADRVFALPGRYFSWPAVTADAGGNLFAVFSCSGSDLFGSACYTAWAAGEGGPREPALLREGEQRYDQVPAGSTRNRWGDYAGIAPDPATGEVWMMHQYARDVGSPLTADWETWIGRTALP